jgi:hypothetical protein
MKKMFESLEDVGAIQTLPEKEGSAYVYEKLMCSIEELEETPERVIPNPEELHEMIQQDEKVIDVISDNYNSRLTTIIIPVFLRGLVDYPGQGGLDDNRSTSEEINGATKQRKNQISSGSESWNG